MIRWKPTFFRGLYSHKNVPTKYKVMESLDIKFGSVCHRMYGAMIILCKLQALSTCSFRVIFNKNCPFSIVCWNLMEFLFHLSDKLPTNTYDVQCIGNYDSYILYFLKKTLCILFLLGGLIDFCTFYNISFSNRHGSLINFTL